jgi:hypothetical protein
LASFKLAWNDQPSKARFVMRTCAWSLQLALWLTPACLFDRQSTCIHEG